MASMVLRDVVVDIPVYNASTRSLKNNVVSAATGGRVVLGGGRTFVRAVDGLSLELGHGTRLALVGHNGAGKSTILKVMAGIYHPTAGRMRSEGTVASMFDIGFGMDEDATGWDNIALRGRLLGFSRREIAKRTPEIAETSELGRFLDMPLRTYSTGMATRLAFAISTAIDPDILLVDEGIGAGDAAFLERAKQRMEGFVGRAGLLVVASHSDDLLLRWCTTGAWMEHGRLRLLGPIREVLDAYHGRDRREAAE
ncbi:ABC transporter ATP-binding protein [Aureimonas leprariae]|uniref:ABC transporter ATP-binding protein n=1 Tax=Plantimonas leprariae TaxID=2615207 RepID=A0A7V7PK80_9HYPH|nr:ABC transporter ATP-binding protein [Aureimonas leprariae]KAB0676012.1 ABC transporter ATP-binding protein [Aureimonas leprariae]